MVVTSRQNGNVRKIKRLISDAGLRQKEGLFVIEGIRLCIDAALSGVKIQTMLYTEQAAPKLGVLRESVAQMIEISPLVSKDISETTTPQGVFCICKLLDNHIGLDTILNNPNLKTGCLALENIRDPANMGAIIRTAEAFGIDRLLISDGCCDIYNPKVLRGSMGGVFRLSIVSVGDMTLAVKRLISSGIECFACVAGQDAELLQNALKPGCVCVIGNEGNGLKPETAAACSKCITIPMAGRAESLNAAMAAGIVMWEISKSLRG